MHKHVNELTNHLGNVLATILDVKYPTTGTSGNIAYMPEIESTTDYYPFGMQMHGRSLNNSDYRFGFQGQEKDDEISGSTGTHYNYTFRMQDARLGRFWSIDPLTKKYPMYSPYHFSSNQPIHAQELEGLECSHDLNHKDLSYLSLSEEGQKHVRNMQGKVGLGGIAAFALPILGMASAPYIASEFSLIANTSWSNLPFVINSTKYLTSVWGSINTLSTAVEISNQLIMKVYENNGDWGAAIKQIDMANIGFKILFCSTKLGKLKYSKLAEEALKSMIDISYEGGYQDVLNGEKSVGKFSQELFYRMGLNYFVPEMKSGTDFAKYVGNPFIDLFKKAVRSYLTGWIIQILIHWWEQLKEQSVIQKILLIQRKQAKQNKT